MECRLDRNKKEIVQDFWDYVTYRMNSNKFWSKGEPFAKADVRDIDEWKNELCQHSNGFLYLKLVLNLIESGGEIFAVEVGFQVFWSDDYNSVDFCTTFLFTEFPNIAIICHGEVL